MLLNVYVHFQCLSVVNVCLFRFDVKLICYHYVIFPLMTRVIFFIEVLAQAAINHALFIMII